MRRFFFFFPLALCLLAPFLADPANAAEKGEGTVLLYTAVGATTPQIPLWAAIHEGWPENGGVTVEYWKTLDDLRGVMLAGKGDFWVGHLEGFAQAALRGAPVRVAAVTGWRKFSCLTPGSSRAATLEELAQELERAGLPLAVAPRDSPALAILENIKKRGGPSFAVEAMQPQQLMLEMARGSRAYAILPEPLATALLARETGFRIAASLEEEFSRLYGGPARLPLAGVAVNADFAARRPETVRKLVAAMRRHGERLAEDSEAAVAALPENVRKNVGESVIRASLPRDLILAVPAAEAKEEIAAFLKMALPRADAAKLEALVNGPFLFGQ